MGENPWATCLWGAQPEWQADATGCTGKELPQVVMIFVVFDHKQIVGIWDQARSVNSETTIQATVLLTELNLKSILKLQGVAQSVLTVNSHLELTHRAGAPQCHGTSCHQPCSLPPSGEEGPPGKQRTDPKRWCRSAICVMQRLPGSGGCIVDKYKSLALMRHVVPKTFGSRWKVIEELNKDMSILQTETLFTLAKRGLCGGISC